MYFANFANIIDVTCKWRWSIKIARWTLCESEIVKVAQCTLCEIESMRVARWTLCEIKVLGLHDGPYEELKCGGCTRNLMKPWSEGCNNRTMCWGRTRDLVESPKSGRCLPDQMRRLHEGPGRGGTVANGRKVNPKVVARTTGFRLRSWKHRPYVDWQTALYG